MTASTFLRSDATFAAVVAGDLPFSASQITASLGGDVALNNVSNYFDGPSIAQGSTGTWFVSGTVTFLDGSSACKANAKLWDGTTVIASSQIQIVSSTNSGSCSLSGYLATPAGNLRISANSNSTSTVLKFNQSGNSKDSTISAFRIA